MAQHTSSTNAQAAVALRPPNGRSWLRLFGIEIQIHWSWLIIFLILTSALASQYFPEAYPRWARWQDWLTGLVTTLLFFTSVLAHELAHSLVARRLGIGVRNITLFVFGGVSNLGSDPQTARDEFRVTIVGPATSFATAGLCWLIWLAARSLPAEPIRAVAGYLASINLILGVFNLLPGFPLDGGRVLRSLLWRANNNIIESTRIAATSGQAVGLLLMVMGFLIVVSGAVTNGIWLIFIGWFLRDAAADSYRQLQIQQGLQGLTVGPLTEPATPLLPPDLTLRQFASEVILLGNRRAGLVGYDAGHIEGLITLTDLRRVPELKWDTTAVAQAMTPLARLITVMPQTSAQSALDLMVAHDVNQLPMLVDPEPPRLLTRTALLRALQNRLELRARK